MRALLNILIILGVLITFGVSKLRFEHDLNHSMVDSRLIQPALKEDTHLQLGQTSAIVALGGLRSLVAAVWNLRAFNHFENLDWIRIEDSYKVITTLQPQTISYWKTGAWHLHTNASVYYNENTDLSPLRRSSMRMKYINKGSALLEEGVRQNPDDWELLYTLAKLWSDYYKKPDLPRAIDYYKAALRSSSLPEYQRYKLERFTFYTMTKSSEHEEEAYVYGKKLFDNPQNTRTPNLITCLFALQNSLDIPKDQRIPNHLLFPDKETELRWLKNYWLHREQGYPMNGVRIAIDSLEDSF
ncbi:MAG: tetratricopeptide repeat protein [Akkermansiaceae bacterium]